MKCPLCGKEFKPFDETEHFCSHECHNAAKVYRYRKVGNRRNRKAIDNVPLSEWIIRQKEAMK